LGEPCKYCCRRDERNGWCYREDGTSAPTAQHGFVERRASGCDVMRRGDGVCDPQCNHPDFEYVSLTVYTLSHTSLSVTSGWQLTSTWGRRRGV
jgi:hypothetical protein